jgi:hypothetical protein
MLLFFFNAKEFVRVNLLPPGMLFTVGNFVDNAIICLASRHTQQ